MSEETTETETKQVSFKVKTGNDGLYSISIAETATVLDVKKVLSGNDYAKVAADNQRLIYSGKLMKDELPISGYKIKEGDTLHMVKKAQSNIAQNPASASPTPAGGAPRAAAGVPQNMAAGTSAGNLLAGLTGARFAGHMGLPGVDTFGADGGVCPTDPQTLSQYCQEAMELCALMDSEIHTGLCALNALEITSSVAMGAPPSEDQVAQMLDDPNMQQMMNEALQNPDMINMIIQQTPQLRDDPNARAMLQSPEFRRMMTDPAALRQAASMRRMFGGGGMPGMGGAPGGGGGFPAPGVTDTTPGAPGANPGAAGANNPFGSLFGPGANPFAAGANPFASMFPQGQTPVQTPPPPASAGQGTPGSDAAAAANPFASLFGGAGAPGAGGLNPDAAAQFQQAMNMFGPGGMFAGGAGAGNPPPPPDTRPPEERYADQLRQLNDMGFFDFDRNIEALRRSGGSVQGAINSLLQ